MKPKEGKWKNQKTSFTVFENFNAADSVTMVGVIFEITSEYLGFSFSGGRVTVMS